MKNKVVSLIQVLFIISLNSCNDPRVLRNEENLQKVEKGMSVPAVKQIMGEPDEVLAFKSEKDMFRFMYEAPIGASDNFYILFSSVDSTVKSINYGD